jgi:hypothetical protein
VEFAEPFLFETQLLALLRRKQLRRVGLRIAIFRLILEPFVFQLVESLKVVREIFGLSVERSLGPLHGCELVRQAEKSIGDGVGGGSQQLAEDQCHQLALAGWERVEARGLEVFGDECIKTPFVFIGQEFLD